MSDIRQRLLDACVGHPHAKIEWPHRLLHDAVSEIDRLRAALAHIAGLDETCADTLSGIVGRMNRPSEGNPLDLLESFAREIRNEALEEAAKAAEAAKCGSDTPWDCGCDPGIKAIRSLAASAKEEKLK